jgi:hypothetical protein
MKQPQQAESGPFGLLPAMSPAGAKPVDQSAYCAISRGNALDAKRISIYLQLNAKSGH